MTIIGGADTISISSVGLMISLGSISKTSSESSRDDSFD
jgi:hypothetical protein